MNKKERKEFRTLLYQLYGAQYMEDKDSVEALYDVPYEWVMSHTKQGRPHHPTLLLTKWKRQFNQTQAICVELLGNTVALEAWNDMVASLAQYNQPDRLRRCLATGMKPETARLLLSTNWPDYVFNSALSSINDANSLLDWNKMFPEVAAAGGLDAIVNQWDEEAKLKTFTNTVLEEPYEPGKVIPLADWKKLAKASRELTLLSLDQIKEKYGLKERPTIAVAFALKLNDNFSSQINKIKTAMQNTTNAAGEMTKEQKRSRIKELEAGLETIKKHKAQIAQVEKTMREKPAATLRTILAVQNDGGHNFEQFTMFGQDFMKPEMMLKIYKVELDEEEARVNVELNKLIA